MNIRELRLRTGLSQQKFADYFHIPFRTLQNWEYGEREAPEYVIELIKYKLEMEGLIMTNEYLEKNAVKIDVVDMREGGIYLGTRTYYLYNNALYCSEYHSNLNRYTGENKTYIIIDNVKQSLEKHNNLYFYDCVGLSEDGYNKLASCTTTLKLIELNEGKRKELTSGTLSEIVDYLKRNTSIYEWQLEEDPNKEMPALCNVETLRELEHELAKVDLSWWSLMVE